VDLKNSTEIATNLFEYQIPSLRYSYIPSDIYGLTNVMNRIQNYYNIIIAEFEIINEYNIIINTNNNLNLTLE
jgi:hypothetical protein